MNEVRKLTGVIRRDGFAYVSLCPELDIFSKGFTRDEAKRNLVAAVERFLETASPGEVQQRLRTDIFVTPIGVSIQ